ncbi:MAG: hypothetical protein K8Q91_02360 [Candidatus Vogelbacteria bacterium]|nr:hypothetical protein [Candidatus Vogelbacteria bacterium]
MRVVIFYSTYLIVCLVLAGPAWAYVASSTNYKLEKDSINFAGARSVSGTYIIEDTLGEISTGTSTSSSYNLNAGYQAMESSGVTISLNLSSPSDVSMSPAIVGASGGTSDGSASWTVVTNNPSGYSLSVAADTNPALKSGANSFDDYTPAGLAPDFSFSVGTSEAKFGFSPEGVDIINRFLDDGSSVCDSGSSDTSGSCWDGFDTLGKTIAASASANNPAGSATVLRLKAVVGATKNLATGSYGAIITATAVTL